VTKVWFISDLHYNQALKPKLRQYFQTDDLFEIAKTREQELIKGDDPIPFGWKIGRIIYKLKGSLNEGN
jgi:calcineurin-like phosphoesterase family protein